MSAPICSIELPAQERSGKSGPRGEKRVIMAITVYTKPSCVQCTATYRALDSKGIEYEAHDLSQDADAHEQVKALGHLPAHDFITDEDHRSGIRPHPTHEH